MTLSHERKKYCCIVTTNRDPPLVSGIELTYSTFGMDNIPLHILTFAHDSLPLKANVVTKTRNDLK